VPDGNQFQCGDGIRLKGIAPAKQEAERDHWSLSRLDHRLRRLNLHMIDADAAFGTALRTAGRERANAWLRRSFRHIGTRSPFTRAKHLTQGVDARRNLTCLVRMRDPGFRPSACIRATGE
jgi:hypothetical protein